MRVQRCGITANCAGREICYTNGVRVGKANRCTTQQAQAYRNSGTVIDCPFVDFKDKENRWERQCGPGGILIADTEQSLRQCGDYCGEYSRCNVR